MRTNIRVSGNILSELSEKIPTNIIALNELMKNSYDAGADVVTITLDEKNLRLLITDDGDGMNLDDINTLFHISVSQKQYGRINKYGRITQGSKGLGFLSVFKFGTKVTWKTFKEAGVQFSVDFEDILKCDEVSNYEVKVIECSDILKGTKIIISLSEYSMLSLKSYLNEEKNRLKLLNAFDDSSFTIKLQIGKEYYENTGVKDIENILPERKLYRVKYNSCAEKLEFYINGFLAVTKDYKRIDDRFLLDLDIVIFQLVQYDKRKISSLFYDFQDNLTPLIYVNSNLFNNYTIFDPNIMRDYKSSLVLGQMIGYISIYSEDSLLNFNSDRTQFLQNELTDKILLFMESINKHIQEVGSNYKNHIMNFDILKHTNLPHTYANASEEQFRANIVNTFKFKDKVKITIEKNYVTYSIFSKEIAALIQEKAAVVPAVIKVKNDKIRIPIISDQILIDDFLLEVADSNRNFVQKDRVNIFVNNELSTTRILESISEECSIPIRFEFIDDITGKTIGEVNLEFYQPTAEVTAVTTKDKLLDILAKEDYHISFNYSIQRLILQLNGLEITPNLELIACSMRALFDISIDCIRQTAKYANLYDGISALEKRVKHTIEYISNDKTKKQQIADNTTISYHSLDNMLNGDDYADTIKKAHLGAHMSTLHITEPEIRNMAHKAGLFLVIANEMISNHI